MTDSEPEPVTAVMISEGARAEADALVRVLADPRPWAPNEARDLIAAAIQDYVNRAELAEIERRQAVTSMHALRVEMRLLSRRGVETWAKCTRCGVRARSVTELTHRPHCTLRSSVPPPMIAPQPPTPPTPTPPSPKEPK